MPYYPPRPDQKPEKEPEAAAEEPKVRDSRLLRYGMIAACVVLIAVGGIQLGGYLSDLFASRRTVRDLKQVMEEPGPETEAPSPARTATAAAVSPSPAPAVAEKEAPGVQAAEAADQPGMLPAVEYPDGLKLVSRIQKLHRKSEYIIGWITMDETDEPVALKDNDFFLNHDATGKRNANGAIFMDEATNLMTRPYTVLLYGHNMKTGAMFGSLRKYADAAYCHQHRFFRFDTLYEEGRYAAFAVAQVSLVPGTARYFSIPSITSLDREVRKKAICELSALSTHDVIVDVSEEDQILLLITCTGNDDERLVLAARRLRDGETEETLTFRKAY